MTTARTREGINRIGSVEAKSSTPFKGVELFIWALQQIQH
jgi:hypothetical protein